MGAVYRATDTTLGRQVAVKILPDAFATDPERLARFERDAKTLAALNHPNTYQPSRRQGDRSSPSGRRSMRNRDRQRSPPSYGVPVQSRLRFTRWPSRRGRRTQHLLRLELRVAKRARVARPARPRNPSGPSYRPPHDERRRRQARPLSPGSGEGQLIPCTPRHGGGERGRPFIAARCQTGGSR